MAKLWEPSSAIMKRSSGSRGWDVPLDLGISDGTIDLLETRKTLDEDQPNNPTKVRVLPVWVKRREYGGVSVVSLVCDRISELMLKADILSSRVAPISSGDGRGASRMSAADTFAGCSTATAVFIVTTQLLVQMSFY